MNNRQTRREFMGRSAAATAGALPAWMPRLAFRAADPGDWGPRHGAFYERLKDVTPAREPGDVAWNLTRFLVDRDGRVLARYEPPVPLEQIRADVLERLSQESTSAAAR